MTELVPPDSHHLSAAVGWLELGNPSEAGEEIAKISAVMLDHPDVLEARWQVCAETQSWEAGLEVAEKLQKLNPNSCSGWLHRAYAVRRVKGGGLDKAWQALRPAFEKFPENPVVPYNLACYACQLGRLEEAWEWLHKAMSAGNSIETIKEMAMADSDLEPLRERIKAL